MDCPKGKRAPVPAFLWGAHAQSGFKEGTRRMQCDHKLGKCNRLLTSTPSNDSELEFVSALYAATAPVWRCKNRKVF
jgi:hypothetical protein